MRVYVLEHVTLRLVTRKRFEPVRRHFITLHYLNTPNQHSMKEGDKTLCELAHGGYYKRISRTSATDITQ
jgi:hypothetical protein